MAEPLKHNAVSTGAAVVSEGLKGAAIATLAIAAIGALAAGGLTALVLSSIGAEVTTAAVLGMGAAGGIISGWLGSAVGIVGGGIAGMLGGGKKVAAENSAYDTMVNARQQELSKQVDRYEVGKMDGKQELLVQLQQMEQVRQQQLHAQAAQEEAAKKAGVQPPQNAANVLASRGAQPAVANQI